MIDTIIKLICQQKYNGSIPSQYLLEHGHAIRRTHTSFSLNQKKDAWCVFFDGQKHHLCGLFLRDLFSHLFSSSFIFRIASSLISAEVG